jgi:hypothetical protein
VVGDPDDGDDAVQATNTTDKVSPAHLLIKLSILRGLFIGPYGPPIAIVP